MRLLYLFPLLIVLHGCITVTGNSTNKVNFDPEIAESMPYEVALDAAVSYSKSMREDLTTLQFSEEGASNRSGGAPVSYGNTCFYAKNVAYTPVDHHAHLFLVNAVNGTPIGDSMLARQYYGQANFERKMDWIGTALMSLGSNYCPEE